MAKKYQALVHAVIQRDQVLSVRRNEESLYHVVQPSHVVRPTRAQHSGNKGFGKNWMCVLKSEVPCVACDAFIREPPNIFGAISQRRKPHTKGSETRKQIGEQLPVVH